MAFAGFSAGEAEGLRRAMSRRRSEAAIRAYEEKFVAGAEERGPRERWPSGSGRRSWASPGSASRRRIRRLRAARLPVDLAAGALPPGVPVLLLNEQPMGFYPPDALVHEAQRCGVEIRPCASPVMRNVALKRVRMGLGYVTGVKEAEVHSSPNAALAGARSATSPAAPGPPRRRSGGSPGRGPATRSWTASPRPGAGARYGCSAWPYPARRFRRARSLRCRSTRTRAPTCAR